MRYIKIIILSIFIIASLNTVVGAHDWYPFSCCSNNDCHPIPCESITERGKALVYNSFGFYDNMIKSSQDGSCHVCIANEFNKDFTPVPRCIFVLQGS